MKAVISAAFATVMLSFGGIANASPTEDQLQSIELNVKLLSAKIENAIAELSDQRSSTNIQNAAYFILAKQEASVEIKMAAIDNVIEKARSIGDQQIVDALLPINLIEDDVVETMVAPDKSPSKTDNRKQVLRAPPVYAATSGSDY